MKLKLNGNKTYAVGIATICYMGLCFFTKQEVDQEFMVALLALGGMAFRHGMAKNEN